MTEIDRFEFLVLGSGEAGKYLAWTMANAGHRTAVVERRWIGGSCPNIACMPSKNVIWSAKVASLSGRGPQLGLPSGSRVDMAAVRWRKRKMVEDMVNVHLDRYKLESNVELIMGEGRFVGPKRLEVKRNDGTVRLVEGDRVFLNVGTHAAIPDIPGLRDANPMTHIEALGLDRIPDHLIVLGGGYIGLELSQAMRRFGSRVTVIQRGGQIASREDVGQALLQLFQEEGIEVLLNTHVLDVAGTSGTEINVTVQTSEKKMTLHASDLLVAIGRIPNTDGIGLELAGVEIDARGYIKVNEELQTTASGVWALGECAGSPQFTHVSFDDFRVVRDTLAGKKRTTKNRLVPFCMFTDPELARVGLNEKEARSRGLAYRLCKLPMTANLREQTLSETRGFMKAPIAKESDQILGFTMFGVEAGEVISVAQTAMLGEMPYTVMRDAIYTHPTIAEGLNVLFRAPPV
ncbi:MAG: FAD-dependent oxidoreductase [Verrucomicrobia bacterium]|nr:FAD-dependent oxidoreductase [Verrucomicrobiota bacterium]